MGRAFSPTALWRARLGPYRTRRLLEVHLAVLLVLTAVAATGLLLSCRQMQRGADALALREAPAVQGLAGTRLALIRADHEARVQDSSLIGVVGAGETYRSQLSAADQSLSRITGLTVRDLGTVRGLFTTYSTSLGLGTSLYRDEPLMRRQKLGEANSLLAREELGLVPRIGGLQKQQQAHAVVTARTGWLQWGGWALTELALLAAALTMLSALFVLLDRCGRRFNPYLLAALGLTVLLATAPAVAAYKTDAKLQAGVASLAEITRTSQAITPTPFDALQVRMTAAEQGERERLAKAQQEVASQSESVREEVALTLWIYVAYRGAFVISLLVIVLPALALGLRLQKDYGRRP
ncbi:MAG TPA: hypothetical protein VFP69_18660 [Streptomyces sp.]|nr:hypothetical protein [Streptomyces sp.]